MTTAGTARVRRWAAVVVGVVVLTVAPWTVGHWPHGGSSLSAATLLQRIRASTTQPYSGYAESVGTLALPVTSGVNGLDDLLGSRTSMRVWWRGGKDWRVDSVSAVGEVDTARDADGTWTWDYQRNTAQRNDDEDEPVRIPVAADLLPPELGRRLLSQATAGEVSRLPVRRVAGIDAVGLRLRTDAASSIGAVEVWADPGTGLPVRVDVYGRSGTGVAALATMSTSLLDLSRTEPAASSTSFSPPAGAATGDGRRFDPLTAAQRFGFVRVPTSLAGLSRNTALDTVATFRGGGGGSSQSQGFNRGGGGVGVYGRGVTELVAVPLFGRTADSFDDQLTKAGAPEVPSCGDVLCGKVTITGTDSTGSKHFAPTPVLSTRQQITIGVLSVLLLRVTNGANWVLTGTVLPQTLTTAADEIVGAG